ncbi:MAG: hypothetical protein PWR29_1270, partial [Methanolobus sp.]|nr:hypothetical protein [Methanolobus sp.]
CDTWSALIYTIELTVAIVALDIAFGSYCKVNSSILMLCILGITGMLGDDPLHILAL